MTATIAATPKHNKRTLGEEMQYQVEHTSSSPFAAIQRLFNTQTGGVYSFGPLQHGQAGPSEMSTQISLRYSSGGPEFDFGGEVELIVLTDELKNREISRLERQLGMSATELLSRYEEDTAPNTFEARLLRALIRAE